MYPNCSGGKESEMSQIELVPETRALFDRVRHGRTVP